MTVRDPGPVPPPPARRPATAPTPTDEQAPTNEPAPTSEHAPTSEPGGSAAGRATDGAEPGVVGEAVRWWSGVPLVGRLLGISTVLLLVGLVLAGVTATWLVQRTLVDQVDDKLATEGVQLVTTYRTQDEPWESQGPPTDYYGAAVETGVVHTLFSPRASVLAKRGTPSLPRMTYDEAEERGGEPFTVTSDRGSDWRVVALPATNTFTNEPVALMVALPLADIDDTIQLMALVLVTSGAVILLAGALVGWWAVRRSLRPLTQIEQTAAAFAAGDFSQRVPPAPVSTEVGRLGAALNGMLAQIEEAFAVRTASEARMRRFVADASHELRTPLAAIRGYGELYRMGALTTKDQVDDTFGRIESSATRMGRLVEDLLSLARLDEQRPMRRTPVDLTVVAADAVSDLHALDPSRSTRIVPLTPGGVTGPTTVDGDEARLRQVVANLVGNVAQHTPAGSPVEIAVGLAHADARDGAPGGPVGVIEVRDHGPGIDPEHAARVFERFYRVDASRGRSSGGAGLGMAIVAAIVDAHDGHVRLSATPGGGTTVRVEIPAARPRPGPGGSTHESPDPQRAATDDSPGDSPGDAPGAPPTGAHIGR